MSIFLVMQYVSIDLTAISEICFLADLSFKHYTSHFSECDKSLFFFVHILSKVNSAYELLCNKKCIPFSYTFYKFQAISNTKLAKLLHCV